MHHDDLELIGIGFLITWDNQARIERKLDRILRMEKEELMDLTALQDMVTNLTTVDESATTLLGQLFALVQANINDPAALQALVDQGNAATATLAAAVTANTPAAPTPTPAPGEVPPTP